MIMILLFAVLVLSVGAVVGVAIATYLRVRRKVDAIPVEDTVQPDTLNGPQE
jgi:hypothetical protein